jgi:hypothetical protein
MNFRETFANFYRGFMKYLKIFGLFISFLTEMGATLPLWAQVSGVSVVDIPAANVALGSQYPIFEFQFTGTANAGDLFQAVTLTETGSTQIGGGDNLGNNVTVWYQTVATPFSPASAVSIGALAGTDHFDWTNSMNFSQPATVGSGYYIFTARLGTSTIPLPETTIGSLDADSVSLTTAGNIPSTAVVNNGAQTAVADATPTSLSIVDEPGVAVFPGANQFPVFDVQVTASSAAGMPLTEVTLYNSGTATTADINAVQLWYEPSAVGPSFNPSQASYIANLSSISVTEWKGLVPDWDVPSGDYLIATVNTSPSLSALGKTIQFQAQQGAYQFLTGSLPAGNLTNGTTQTILTPTPTFTFTETPTVTPIPPTATNTPTDTSVPPTSTDTPTTSPIVIPTFADTATPTPTPTITLVIVNSPTNTPTVLSNTFTPTDTLTVPPNTPTNTNTALPTPTLPITSLMSPTITPTPNVALYLDNNSFNPTTNPSLGMDVRVDVAGEVKIIVFNIAGQEVRKILDANLGVGNTRDYWDGRNNGGALVGNGLYFILIQTPSTKLIRKVIVLK